MNCKFLFGKFIVERGKLKLSTIQWFDRSGRTERYELGEGGVDEERRKLWLEIKNVEMADGGGSG